VTTPVLPIGPSSVQIKDSLLNSLAPRAGKIPAIVRSGGYTSYVRTLTGGRLTITWWHYYTLVATGRATFSSAGEVPVHVRLTGRGRRLLKASRHLLRLTAKVSYSSIGTIVASKAFTLRR
jgi:hypothetical protein